MIDNFVSLHSHTHYSNNGMYDSTARIEDIIERVYELEQTAWAITDHGTMTGVLPAYVAVQKFNKKMEKKGINYKQKVILGCEMYYCHDLLIKDTTYHLLVLAYNNTGYYNLNKLDTIAQGNKGENPENFYRKPRIDLETLAKYKEGLYIGTACLGGFVNSPNGEYLLQQFKEVFGDKLFIELHTYQNTKQKEWNKTLVKYAQKYNIMMVAATDSHYITKDKAESHRLFNSNGKEKEYYDTDDFYLHSEEEVRQKLSYLPSNIVEQAIKNTKIVADNCNVEIEFGKKHYPTVCYKEGNVEKLKSICRSNFKKKVSDKSKWKEYGERFNKEIKDLITQDYIDYFLITWDLLDYCIKNGIPTAPGRGSVVGCLIAYLMNITKIDPIEYNLPFERFCNTERVSPPDKNKCRALWKHNVLSPVNRIAYGCA